MSQLFGMDNAISSLQGNYTKVTNEASSKAANTKNTFGNPKLSDSASKYYEELKAKHSDVEFVLVDDKNVATAKEQAANINSNKSMIVLISEDEVEEMAANEDVRTKNEKLIADAKTQMPELLAQLKDSGTEVKSFGMEFNDDGTASYFAVVDKSMAAQKERIENKVEEKRAEKKEAQKESSNAKVEDNRYGRKENLTTVTASSMEELIRKIKDTMYMAKADTVMTAQEKMIGQSFDLSI